MIISTFIPSYLSCILLVFYYRRKHRLSWKKFLGAPIALILSSLLFFSCFVILYIKPPSRGTTIAQYVLWSLAMVVEAVGHWFTPDDLRQNLVGYGSLTERLGTVTVIVLGEGTVLLLHDPVAILIYIL